MAPRFKLSGPIIFALFVVMGLPSVVRADPFQLSIAAPNFLIPLAGQNGTLTVYSDGRAPTRSGFNALGSQTFNLGGHATSTGYLTLNLYFTGFPLGRPDQIINDAFIQFTVRDLDFLTDHVTNRVTLNEAAIIRSVNGTNLATAINLANYLPNGTRSTDDRTITLKPIDLMPPLSGSDFTNPFILSLRLTATAHNSGSHSVQLTNTTEGIMSGIRLTGNFNPKPPPPPPPPPPQQVPEPMSAFLLGIGLLAAYRKHRSGDFTQ